MNEKNSKDSRGRGLFSCIAEAGRKVIPSIVRPMAGGTNAHIPIHTISDEGMKIIENIISLIGDDLVDKGRVELIDEELDLLGYNGCCMVTPIKGNTTYLITIYWREADECRTVKVRYENRDNWEIFYIS